MILVPNHSHRMRLCPNEYILLTYWKIGYRISLKIDTWDSQDFLVQITLSLDLMLYHLKQLVESQADPLTVDSEIFARILFSRIALKDV